MSGIPFNAANSRQFEIAIEATAQYGSGYKPPTYHELREPLLEKVVKETDDLRKRHEDAWKQYGCTLMSDGWTDRRGHHLINFLVNSPEGTFFLESIDASSEVHDQVMLADLLEKRISDIGVDKVVQVVTDNGANYKAAGKLLMERFPTLYWTPCAAHCLDLMLEDVGKLKAFKKPISRARHVTTFIYRHGRLLSAMREKTGGRDLVRPVATRFATIFLTLQSLHKHRDALRYLFTSDDWTSCKLAKTEAGKKVYDIVLSSEFWNSVEDCLRASLPLIIVLRVVDGDERPAMPEVASLMNHAKERIKAAFCTENKRSLLNNILQIIEGRWDRQMDTPLYGAALFLNPGKFYAIQKENDEYVGHLRGCFNDVLARMVEDETLRNKIEEQSMLYEDQRGGIFKNCMALQTMKSKNPLDWWRAYGGRSIDLQRFAKRIVSLCASSSGCERNWSTFEFIHTKKRNRLEHKRLNDLVYVAYNRKMTSRFKNVVRKRVKAMILWLWKTLIGKMNGLIQRSNLKILVLWTSHGTKLMKQLVHHMSFEVVTFLGPTLVVQDIYQEWLKKKEWLKMMRRKERKKTSLWMMLMLMILVTNRWMLLKMMRRTWMFQTISMSLHWMTFER
ncbi:uncharacterized protein LOC133928660 [Phragmites australis]|uniref:uncharacterized protein LOC133928660 n=1 Tax=Phragmites australis TaxID=29695 RepID=UPI002D79C9CB|nr:uncharacterized protein LOC133928660 [Phragmites australis]XP_062231078.1 uncharacterized protein LOC133928660 [Phragmites australis]